MLENQMNTYRDAQGDYRGDPGALLGHFRVARDLSREPLQEYALLAPSVEEAKQRSEDFLHVYDRGLVPWLQKLIEAEKAALKTARDEAQPKLAEIDKKIDIASREVDGVEGLGEQAISDLKVKRTLLKVELAGVKARLSAIEGKLKPMGSETPEATRGKLADLKVTAEIDLASLAAQQKVLDELIDGQRRLAQIAHLRQVRTPYASRIENADEGLPRCDEILAELKLFQLVDDTVVIRPLRFHVK